MSRKGRSPKTSCRKSGRRFIGGAPPDGWATTMAAKKKSSRTPAVRYLRYNLTNSATPGTETSHYIDLARDLSALNRRLYRQGRDYHVKRVSIVSSNTIAGVVLNPDVTVGTQNAGRVTIGTIPDSWMARNAWNRGFNIWNKMNKMATANIKSDIKGTWSDFKVYLSLDSRSATLLNPLDNGGNAVRPGMWVYSQLVTPDGTTSADTFDLHMLGNHSGSAGSWNSVGLIRSYGESRATVQGADPNVPTTVSDDPIMNVFDDGTQIDEIIEDLEGQNDFPPYDVDEYPGDDTNMPKPLVVQQTTLGADGRATVGSFTAMCGLLEIETTSPIGNDVYSVLVELAPGSYRGIAADVIA